MTIVGDRPSPFPHRTNLNIDPEALRKGFNKNAVAVTPKERIDVTAQGAFKINGRELDLVGLVFMVQEATGEVVQKRLVFTATELAAAQRKSKMIVFFLNKVRAYRPPSSKHHASNTAMVEAFMEFKSIYGKEPFEMLGLKNMNPMKKPLPTKEEWEGIKNSHYRIVFKFKMGALINKVGQGQIDQLIEGMKSNLSGVNSKQQLVQLDSERYSRMVDETKEATKSIENSVANAADNESNKI